MSAAPGRLILAVQASALLWAAGPPGVTSLTNGSVKYSIPPGHSVTLNRGPLHMVVVDNAAVGSEHLAGYNGIAVLSHRQRPANLFVPLYSGLNLEVIHDGTNAPRDVLFEPRRAPIELRVVNRSAVELYQPPTPNWKLESCTRFELEKDGVVRMTFECIPRGRVFQNGYIGLFWASYVHQPESPAIYFLGKEKSGGPERWIEAVSPRHGLEATHISEHDKRDFLRAGDFQPRYQIFSWSRYVYTQSFYYGLSHGMAYVLMFWPTDLVRFTQSPSGGGPGNPALDFQWFVPDYATDQAYGFELRMAYVPFRSPDQIQKLYAEQLRKWRR